MLASLGKYIEYIMRHLYLHTTQSSSEGNRRHRESRGADLNNQFSDHVILHFHLDSNKLELSKITAEVVVKETFGLFEVFSRAQSFLIGR